MAGQTSVEEVKINFYSIHKCGFYFRGKDSPDFSGVDDVLSQLQKWTKGIDLSLTKISDPSASADQLPVYLFGIQNVTDSWVMATWNEVPATESGVPSISRDSKVGAPQVRFSAIGVNDIPGYATYFWFIPSRNVVASIQFNRRLTGQTAMRDYIGRFMSSFMTYTVVSPTKAPDGSPVVIGYTNLPDRKPKVGLRPVFKTGAFSKPGEKRFILKNFDKIRKVVRRGQLTSLKTRDMALWQNTLRFFYLDYKVPPAMPVSQKAYVELEFRPTLPQVTEMIVAEENNPDVSGWDDMGFILDGDPKTHWLGREAASGEFSLPIKRVNDEQVDLTFLLSSLESNRSAILKLLD